MTSDDCLQREGSKWIKGPPLGGKNKVGPATFSKLVGDGPEAFLDSALSFLQFYITMNEI